jgi:HAD superfamily hydrolase (TIGR01450 family)
MSAPPFATAKDLLEKYDVFFLDAYGVLVNAEGPLPGAAEFLQEIVSQGKSYFLLSNDSSRGPHTTWKRYTGFGLPLQQERIITAGMLLPKYFATHGLVGAPCMVLGTDDSRAYVEAAGGFVVSRTDTNASVFVLADDLADSFLDTINDAVTVLFSRLERGLRTHLILPNPDLVFPRNGGFGVTAGAIAHAVEAALTLRDPSGKQKFVPLGKPESYIFDEGFSRLPAGITKDRVVMVGDQLATDVLGASRAGIDSALMLTGVSRLHEIQNAHAKPTHILQNLG